MVCIYYGNNTQVTNSRPQRRLHQTWRRRVCTKCGAIFTTNELVDLTTSIVVRHNDGTMVPFSRDQLFVSVLQAVGHRDRQVLDAGALTATITARLMSKRGAVLAPTDIRSVAIQVLKHFDKAAAVQYAAYHK